MPWQNSDVTHLNTKVSFQPPGKGAEQGGLWVLLERLGCHSKRKLSHRSRAPTQPQGWGGWPGTPCSWLGPILPACDEIAKCYHGQKHSPDLSGVKTAQTHQPGLLT